MVVHHLVPSPCAAQANLQGNPLDRAVGRRPDPRSSSPWDSAALELLDELSSLVATTVERPVRVNSPSACSPSPSSEPDRDSRLAVARRFGRQGFGVALISRNSNKLASLVEQLAEAGVLATPFPADVTDARSLMGALSDATAHFGDVEILEYSPYAGLERVSPLEVTVENLHRQVESILYGAVTAAGVLWPSMLKAKKGTLLFTVGGGAINPYPILGTVNTAQAALRNWVLNLHGALSGTRVYAACIAINAMIAQAAPEGVPHAAPDEIAEAYSNLHVRRDKAEQLIPAAS
jgi:NADP-dependent 3-hydroxy acid dehydrogenase YdfG